MNLTDRTAGVNETDGAVVVHITKAPPGVITPRNVEAYTGMTERQFRSACARLSVSIAQLSGEVWAVETVAFLDAVRSASKPKAKRKVAVPANDDAAALAVAGLVVLPKRAGGAR